MVNLTRRTAARTTTAAHSDDAFPPPKMTRDTVRIKCPRLVFLFEGFTGLPSAWRMVLKASGITKEEAVEHPQAVLDALAFHMDGAHPAAQQMRPKMPSKEAIAKTVTEVRCAVLCCAV